MIKLFCTKNELEYKNIQIIHLSKIDFLDFDPVVLDGYKCLVFTSKNAVLSLEHTIKKHKYILNTNTKIICVGKATKQAAQNLGFKDILLPKKAYGKNLFDEFNALFLTHKTLFLRGEKIASNPKNVDELIIYQNTPLNMVLPKLEQDDILIFTSPMMVKYFQKSYKKLHKNIKIIAIGTSTKKAILYKNKILIPSQTTIHSCVRLAHKIHCENKNIKNKNMKKSKL